MLDILGNNIGQDKLSRISYILPIEVCIAIHHLDAGLSDKFFHVQPWAELITILSHSNTDHDETIEDVTKTVSIGRHYFYIFMESIIVVRVIMNPFHYLFVVRDYCRCRLSRAQADSFQITWMAWYLEKSVPTTALS